VANTALAFATLGYHSEVFFASFCKIIPDFIKEGNEQNIINVCYAFTILDLTGKYEKEFRQLWSAAVGFDSKNDNCGGVNAAFFRSLLIRWHGAWKFRSLQVPASSKLTIPLHRLRKKCLQFFACLGLNMMRSVAMERWRAFGSSRHARHDCHGLQKEDGAH
jgi:hypothetical protein